MLKLMSFNFNVRFTHAFASKLIIVNRGRARDIVDIVYTLGISSLWDEVCHMPVGGVVAFNVDRYADAVSLMNQTLESQAQDSKVAAIVMGKP